MQALGPAKDARPDDPRTGVGTVKFDDAVSHTGPPPRAHHKRHNA